MTQEIRFSWNILHHLKLNFAQLCEIWKLDTPESETAEARAAPLSLLIFSIICTFPDNSSALCSALSLICNDRSEFSHAYKTNSYRVRLEGHKSIITH